MQKDLDKEHVLLWGRFQLALSDRVEDQTGFEASIRNKPIDMLLAIKRHALDYEESRIWMPVVSDTFRELFNCAQENNEVLLDCTRRFKRARETLQSHLRGPMLVAKTMKDTCPAQV